MGNGRIVIAVLSALCIGPFALATSGNTSDDTRLAAQLRSLPNVRSVETWTFGSTPGLVFQTRHYRMHTTLLDPLVLLPLPAFLESAWQAYQIQLPQPASSRFPFTVYLFASREQWEAFTREFAGSDANAFLAIEKGAYYLNGACVVYHIGVHQTRSALGHEGWHQFTHRHFAFRLPSWLDEGLATQFEASQQYGGRTHFVPRRNLYRLSGLRRAIEQGYLLSVSDLLTMNPAHVLGNEDRLAAFYAQAYALIRFLREADHGVYIGRFQRLLHDARTGAWPLSAEMRRIAADRNIPISAEFNRAVSLALFRLYIAQVPEQLDARYRAFCIELAGHLHPKDSTP